METKYKINQQCNVSFFYLTSANSMFYLELVPEEYVGGDRTTVDLPIDIFEPTDA